jgi:mRNA interferase RelE/StbE
MPEFRITFARSAARDLDRLDPPIAWRILSVIERLSHDPRPPRCVKLTGSQNDWRIRIGDWRVIYTVNDAIGKVDIVAVGHRGDIYR